MQDKQPKRFLQCKTLYSVSPTLFQLAHTMKEDQGQLCILSPQGFSWCLCSQECGNCIFVNLRVRGEGAYQPNAQTVKAYPSFLCMKHVQEYCYSPLDGMLAHCRVTTQQYVAGTHLYTWVKWSKVPCLRKQCDG